MRADLAGSIEDGSAGAKRVERRLPTRWESIVFRCKVWGLRARRCLQDARDDVRRWPRATAEKKASAAHEVRSRLWVSDEPSERRFELGKVENLRRACDRLDGIVVPAGGTFSFWKQVGAPTRGRGFVEGRMLEQGCVVPGVGGGLCQVSNALYVLALRTGCEIVERHAHSVRLPGAPAQDATVAWNYVDLRFRVPCRTRIVVNLNTTELVVGFEQTEGLPKGPRVEPFAVLAVASHVQSCATCGETECFRHEEMRADRDAGEEGTAFLFDEGWREFGGHLGRMAGAEKALVISSRDYVRNAEQVERSVGRWVRALRPEIVHVCVSRSLLSVAWRRGAMRGRTFDVLMPEGAVGSGHAACGAGSIEDEALAGARMLISPDARIAAAVVETHAMGTR